MSIVSPLSNNLSFYPVSASPTKKRKCARYKGSSERRMQRLNILNKEIDDLRTVIVDKQANAVELIKAINKRDREYQECIQEQPRGGMRSRRVGNTIMFRNKSNKSKRKQSKRNQRKRNQSKRKQIKRKQIKRKQSNKSH